MKQDKYILCFLFIFSTALSMKTLKHKTFKASLNSKIDDPSSFQIKDLSLTEQMMVGTMKLSKRLQENQIYDTWIIENFEVDRKKMYIAHIFKYAISPSFVIKPTDLSLFCSKINEFNALMGSSDAQIGSLHCKGGGPLVASVGENTVTHILFPMPMQSLNLCQTCKGSVGQVRICKYNQKMIAGGCSQAEVHSKQPMFNFRIKYES